MSVCNSEKLGMGLEGDKATSRFFRREKLDVFQHFSIVPVLCSPHLSKSMSATHKNYDTVFVIKCKIYMIVINTRNFNILGLFILYLTVVTDNLY